MNNPQSPQKQTPRPPSISWFWWLVLAALMVWNFYAFLPKGQPTINLAYSAFLAQVEAGNVAHVKIVGDQITGGFAKAYTPPVAPTPSAATPQPAPTAANQSYMQFSTTFPADVGDPREITCIVARDREPPGRRRWAVTGYPLVHHAPHRRASHPAAGRTLRMDGSPGNQAAVGGLQLWTKPRAAVRSRSTEGDL